MQRRLTTILAADIAGFSRLIGIDEEAVLATQRGHRTELIDPLLGQHEGRVANTAGDSLLIEFPSAVEAVRFAMAVQQGMVERNADIPADRRIEYRVGINVGDVMAEGEDLLGDGVNIAARLEGLAPPGGIVISRTVRDQVRDRTQFDLADLGEVTVKNIARPVRAFQILREGEATLRVPTSLVRKSRALAVAGIVLAAFVGTGFYWNLQRGGLGGDQVAGLALPDKPSIAILPFQNLSGDGSQNWMGDGMSEDIITDLSKISGLFVIARNSSFQYRGGDLDLRRVGRELGVRYLLEGSVRRAGDTVRINTQLIDASTGGHVWADRYDGAAGEIFALQDRVTSRVVESLSLTLTDSEAGSIAAADTSDPAAHDAFLQGLSHMRNRTPEDYAAARVWFDKALDLDPTHARALGARALLYVETSYKGWGHLVGTDGRLDAVIAIRAALEHPSPQAYVAEASFLLGKPDAKAARAALDRGIALDPNDADLYISSADVETGLGNHDRAMQSAERALRLNPKYPPEYLYSYGAARHVAGDIVGAIALFDRSITRNPSDWAVYVYRSAALIELGQADAAAADLQVVKENWPGDWAPLTAPGLGYGYGRYYGYDYTQRLTKAFLAAGLPKYPEGYDIRPEFRLDYAAQIARRKTGERQILRFETGDYMNDVFPDGKRISYWNGTQTATSTETIRDDAFKEIRMDDPLENDIICESYRNPGGSNETFDAYFGVCNIGVFKYGVFPLP